MCIKIKKTEVTLEMLLSYCESKFIKEFDLCNFQRKYRKFFKFNVVSNDLFFIKSKISKHSMRLALVDINRFSVTTSKNANVYTISIVNDKELIHKLLKHDLI